MEKRALPAFSLPKEWMQEFDIEENDRADIERNISMMALGLFAMGVDVKNLHLRDGENLDFEIKQPLKYINLSIELEANDLKGEGTNAESRNN